MSERIFVQVPRCISNQFSPCKSNELSKFIIFLSKTYASDGSPVHNLIWLRNEHTNKYFLMSDFLCLWRCINIAKFHEKNFSNVQRRWANPKSKESSSNISAGELYRSFVWLKLTNRSAGLGLSFQKPQFSLLVVSIRVLSVSIWRLTWRNSWTH